MIQDLSGQVFGRLTVLHRSVDHIYPSGKHTPKWLCRCECGNEVEVMGKSLRSGNTTSCGCYQKSRASNIGAASVKDLSNQHFGSLTVICRAPNGKKKSGKEYVVWHCLCECGNEVDVASSHLISGHSQSCGCRKCETPSNFLDLKGQRFGFLSVIERADKRIFPSGQTTMWHCRCDCGNEVDVALSNLKTGNTQSCGCMKSWMEYYVLQYCNSKGFVVGTNYEYQKRYDDLTGVGGRKLSFDFLFHKDGIPHCFVECQGAQHLRPVKYFGGDEKFEIQQFHDELKREYAKSIGVPLLEIPYTADKYEKVAEILRNAGI